MILRPIESKDDLLQKGELSDLRKLRGSDSSPRGIDREADRKVPLVIERVHLELSAVRKAIHIVHSGRRTSLIASNDARNPLLIDAKKVSHVWV
jgi:hypothetical protein